MTKPSLTELIETGVFGIAGVVVEVQESLPKLVAKGKSTLEPKLGMARFVGRFALNRLESEFQKRSDSTLDQITDLVSTLFGLSDEQYDDAKSADAQSPANGGALLSERTVITPVPAAKGGDADHLPIDGYRTLSAQQIIARLNSLNLSELDAIARYESKHRNRTSIMRSVDAKRANL